MPGKEDTVVDGRFPISLTPEPFDISWLKKHLEITQLQLLLTSFHAIIVHNVEKYFIWNGNEWDKISVQKWHNTISLDYQCTMVPW